MEKTKGEELKEKLFNKNKIGFAVITEEEKQTIFSFSDEYLKFLNSCKTERECASFAEDYLKQNGFVNIENKTDLVPGDKVYFINHKKAVYAAAIGSSLLEEGLNFIGAHIDSPRLDLKPNPLYEDGGFALFKTHYYGGIKKYQWTTIPLAIHGVIAKPGGEVININIGEDESDPIFTITDLLPHLAAEQQKKSLANGIAGEDLNLLIGSIPYDDEKVSEKIKLNILNILNMKYGIVEKDFISAELEIVPAFRARSLGFDSSMIAAYGQDDRSCAYTALRALSTIKEAKKTAVMILSDKEEVGSMGNTGMESHIFEVFVAELLNKSGQNGHNTLDKTLSNSKMLSADVTSGSDPTYASVDEKKNAAYLGKGIALAKYTGARGKSGASDANAEFVAYVRNILESNNLLYQMSDMGKVDEGGGGTIAYILANKGIDVIDCGVPVLSMHAPYEVTNKFDIYNAYQFYKAFYEN
ncbi:MAG: aminopeptidase [Bacilli bacterium]